MAKLSQQGLYLQASCLGFSEYGDYRRAVHIHLSTSKWWLSRPLSHCELSDTSPHPTKTTKCCLQNVQCTHLWSSRCAWGSGKTGLGMVAGALWHLFLKAAQAHPFLTSQHQHGETAGSCSTRGQQMEGTATTTIMLSLKIDEDFQLEATPSGAARMGLPTTAEEARSLWSLGFNNDKFIHLTGAGITHKNRIKITLWANQLHRRKEIQKEGQNELYNIWFIAPFCCKKKK